MDKKSFTDLPLAFRATDGVNYRVNLNDLVYVEVKRHYCLFFFDGFNAPLVLRCNLGDLHLPLNFEKINRSFIVNIWKVKSFCVDSTVVRWNEQDVYLGGAYSGFNLRFNDFCEKYVDLAD